jgi:hypothetical protein
MQNKKNDDNLIKLAKWAIKNKSNFIFGFVGLLALGAVGFRVMPKMQKNKAKDYFAIKSSFASWKESSQAASDSEYQKLIKLVRKHPVLQANYESQIAQRLLFWKKNKEGVSFANKSLKRTDGEKLPYFQNYAKTSLLISQNIFDKALKESLLLSTKIKKDKNINEFSVLYKNNLLRIAVLQKKLNLSKDEITTLRELDLFIKNSKKNKHEKDAYPFYDNTAITNFLNHRLKQSQ